MAAQMKGIVNPSLKIQHQDTLNVLEKLQKGEEKLFNISLYLGARAYDRDKLNLYQKRFTRTKFNHDNPKNTIFAHA